MTRPFGSKRDPVTPLYVRCPLCRGTGEKHEPAGMNGDAGGVTLPCMCHSGFVETGFTQERFDSLIRDNDRLLMLLADVMGDGPGAFTSQAINRRRAEELLRERQEELVAARSRTQPKQVTG